MITVFLLLRVLIFPGLLFIFLLTLLFEWYERKLNARLQNRSGPRFTGPVGLLQPFADFVKLLSKEDLVPTDVNQIITSTVPVLSLAIFAFAWLLIHQLHRQKKNRNDYNTYRL